MTNHKSKDTPISENNTTLSGDYSWDAYATSSPGQDLEEAMKVLHVTISQVCLEMTPDVYWWLVSHPDMQQGNMKPLLYISTVLIEGEMRCIVRSKDSVLKYFDIFPFGEIPKELSFKPKKQWKHKNPLKRA